MASARCSLFSALFVLVLSVLGSGYGQPSGRILGGAEADKTSFPYAASLRLDGAHICGASIISDEHILTAAHCVTEKDESVAPSRLSVRVGSTNQFSGGHIVAIAAITVHPKFEFVKNDIAVLTLAKSLTFTDRIASISFAKTPAQEPAEGDEVTVAGWGEQTDSSSSFKLQYTKFTVASDDVCFDAYSESDASTVCLSHNSQHGSCRGDAGNGAVYEDRLVAVSSFVVGACGARYPDVFTNVAHYADWIVSVITK